MHGQDGDAAVKAGFQPLGIACFWFNSGDGTSAPVAVERERRVGGNVQNGMHSGAGRTNEIRILGKDILAGNGGRDG